MKTVGIIGGLGPETTAEFYLRLIAICREDYKLARPPILMWSIPLEYQIEEELITLASGEERYIPYLIDAAKRLEAGGADFIVIPCNSVHIFINQVRASVKIPVLSIVETTLNVLRQSNITDVGLLATKTTVDKNLYGQILSNESIKVHHLEPSDQKEIGTIINRLVLKEETEGDRKSLITMVNNFVRHGIQTVLLACTDLQLLIPEIEGVNIFDTMEILARETVREILD
ncbi:MAG TPA: amino acid racemase [Patescibacteria group bacterium]|nr:amino acid racemase [Patescibacteria group bacterium]